MVVVMDNYTRVVLTVIAVLLTLIVIPLWTQGPDVNSTAMAANSGIPDAGQQLNELISISADNKSSLEYIAEHLTKGTLKVEIVESDKKTASEPVFSPDSKVTFRRK